MTEKKEKTKQRLINDLSKEMAESNLAVFIGAGLSIPAGYASWNKLLAPIAEALDLDIEKELDLVTLAQYHYNDQQSRGKINQLLIDEFSKEAKATENHEILARLPISTFWTTNYDKLIEDTLCKNSKIVDIKYTNNHLVITKQKRDAIVYKMHGDIDHPDKAILIKDDYEAYHLKMQPFLNALSGDLTSKTFLFLGFSFTDPNLDYILSRVRLAYNENQRPHYCLSKKVSMSDCKDDKAEYEYKSRKQELFIQDLKRFGINTVLIDDYDEITEILSKLEQKYKHKTVFISGAAHEYKKWGKEASEKFVYELSKKIAAHDFKIVSGFGLGVGSSVIAGVLEHVYMSGNRLNDEQLILRPFPQSEEGKSLWTEYREDMLSHAGIAIFIFGNKLENGEIVPSSGMRDEFNIARKKGLVLLPIGATGDISKDLWLDAKTDIQNRFGKNAEIMELYEKLGDEDLTTDELTQVIIDLLKHFQQ
ncbi:MAG: SIR2 family protein [Candidatus Omnitrophica bacterium]|nr:SIR2 family protein [Candidatus Omnitrophota bacterium]MDD5551152.1 SIR2 family protein [Candidatus Omnitrophota bacterium]